MSVGAGAAATLPNGGAPLAGRVDTTGLATGSDPGRAEASGVSAGAAVEFASADGAVTRGAGGLTGGAAAGAGAGTSCGATGAGIAADPTFAGPALREFDCWVA